MPCRPISVLRYAHGCSPRSMQRFLRQAERWFRKRMASQYVRGWRVYVDDGRTSPPVTVILACASIENAAAMQQQLIRSVRRARAYSSVEVEVRVLTPETARQNPAVNVTP